MKKAKHNIDDLLKVVSPDILEAYQSRSSLTLSEVNEEYKIFCRRNNTGDLKLGILISAAIILFGFSFVTVLAFGPNNLSLALFLVVVLTVIWISFPISKQQEEHSVTLAGYEKFLVDFRQTLNELNPTLETVNYYTEESVREVLIHLMMRTILAERGFNDVCSRRHLFTTERIVSCGNEEIERRALYEKTKRATEKFGLAFSNREISSDAEKDIAKRGGGVYVD